MKVEKEYGVLVQTDIRDMNTILGVATSINGVYALVGLWMPREDKLDDQLESMLTNSPVNGELTTERWYDVFGQTFRFNQVIVVTEEE